jgi:hypothetical protein
LMLLRLVLAAIHDRASAAGCHRPARRCADRLCDSLRRRAQGTSSSARSASRRR